MSSGGKESASQSEIEAKLNHFEGRIDDLKHAYDMYFNGIDRRPPHQLQKEVTRLLRTLEHRLYIQSTAQKFRLKSLVQRYQTYKQYWDRILRQIEEGTYVRDRVKAQRKSERMEQRAEQEEQGPLELDLDLDAIDDLDLFAQNISSQAPPQPVARPEQPVHHTPQPVPAPAAVAAAPQVDEDIRAQRIRELQAKLGISQPPAPSPPVPSYAPPAQPLHNAASEEEQRKAKLDAMRRRLEQRASRNTQPPPPQPPPQSNGSAAPASSSGYSREQLQQKLRARQHRAQPPQASSQGSSEDARVQQVYRNLVEAKRRCNEPTENLTYESVARSMAQQRERLKQTHNANDVDFKVVIKSGRAYLKPEPK